MKTILFSIVILSFISCSKDCEEQSKNLQQLYENGIRNANGNTDAIRELKAEYNNAKANLDC